MDSLGFGLGMMSKEASNQNQSAPKSQRRPSMDIKSNGRATPIKKNKQGAYEYQSSVKPSTKPLDSKKYYSEVKSPLRINKSTGSVNKHLANSQKSIIRQATQQSAVQEKEEEAQKQFLLVVNIESIRPLLSIEGDKQKTQYKLTVQVGNKDALRQFDSSEINLLNWKAIFPAKESNMITVNLTSRERMDGEKDVKYKKSDVAFTKIPLVNFFKFEGVRHSLAVDLADSESFQQRVVKKYGMMNMEFLILKQKIGKLRIQEIELMLNESTDYLKGKSLHIEIASEDSAHLITTKPVSTNLAGNAKWKDIDPVPIDNIRSRLQFRVYSAGTLSTSLICQAIFDPYKKHLFQEGNSREVYELVMEVTDKKRFRLLVKGKFNESKEIEIFE